MAKSRRLATLKKSGPKKQISKKLQFSVDCAVPIGDKIFDLNKFEKYIHDRFKVDQKVNNLSGKIDIKQQDSKLLFSTQGYVFSKRYIKYLTKKFLKKHGLRDWLRIISINQGGYHLKYFGISAPDEVEDKE